MMLANTFKLAMASATMDLILGGVIGGPISRRLISRNNLTPGRLTPNSHKTITFSPQSYNLATPKNGVNIIFHIILHGLEATTSP
jgi:ESS family glutamate:Na+ symporter